MHRMASNLMIFNKLIIFCENLVNDDIDGYLFTNKLENDINFISNVLGELFQEYVSNYEMYEKENILKTYTATLKRFYRLLQTIDTNSSIISRFNVKCSMIVKIKQDVEDRMKMIKTHGYRSNMIDTEKQCINADEYSILFQELPQQD